MSFTGLIRRGPPGRPHARHLDPDLRAITPGPLRQLNSILFRRKPESSGMPHLVELSHVISAGMVTYPGLPGPVITDHLSRHQAAQHYGPGVTFHIGRIEMVANTGTYLDVPSHRFADGADLADHPLESMADLAGLCVRTSGLKAIGAQHFERLDLTHKAVLVHTGWSEHFGTERYADDAPFLTGDAARLFVEQGASLVGIDSINIDDIGDMTRPAHTQLLAAGIPIVEHLTNLEALPDHGFRFFALPPRIEGMGTFPVRAIARVD